MPILHVDLPISEFSKLTRLARSTGAEPEDLGARILKTALQSEPGQAELDDLPVKRAIAAASADRSPWNNEVDAEWDNWQP